MCVATYFVGVPHTTKLNYCSFHGSNLNFTKIPIDPKARAIVGSYP